MPIQIATTGQLENAQRIAIGEARYTTEHNAPVVELVENMQLADGEKQVDVPKVAQMTAAALADGVDLVQSQDIGMTTTTLTATEAGLKVILSDKLARQTSEDVFKIVGRQMGDAMARLKDTDLLALFTALNGGTSLGAAGATLTLPNLGACVDFATRNKFSRPQFIVTHPSSLFDIVHQSVMNPSLTATLPSGLNDELLRDFYAFKLNNVGVFHDGNITVDGSDDAIGAVFAKNAMVHLESVGFDVRRQRDESLRATEVIALADYGSFELDDAEGAPITYDAAAPSTSA